MKLVLISIAFLCIVMIACREHSSNQKPEPSKPSGQSGKKVLMIIAPENFRDEEYFTPKGILEKAGIQVTTASMKKTAAKGMLGGTASPDINLDEVTIDYYDAVIFVGGSGASVYFDNSTAHAIARKAKEKGIIIAAICIAPSTLANTGILQDKKATAFASQKDHLIEKGALFQDQDVVVDGNIITANGPGASEEFGNKLAEMLITD